MDANEIVKTIKKDFFLRMNGVLSSSMRDKGLDYKINWGVTFNDLKSISLNYTKNHELALALWSENIRECKILATMLMPPTEITLTEMKIWVSESKTLELIEFGVFNLYQYIPGIEQEAFRLIESDKIEFKICGYLLCGRLFMNKNLSLDKSKLSKYIKKSEKDLKEEGYKVKRAVLKSLEKYGEISINHQKQKQQLLERIQ